MGTHGAMAVTEEDGKHFCVERTMDGGELAAIIGQLDHLHPAGLSSQAYAAAFGSGDVETDDDREHDQMYFVHVNWQGKYIGIDGVTFLEAYDLELGAFVQRWWDIIHGLPIGWTLKWEADCPHAMEADATEAEGGNNDS